MSQDHFLLAGDHASRWLGIEVEQVGEGHARITMLLREDMLNGFGMAHGGMIFAFADTCFALASNDPAGPKDTITVGAGVDINYVSSARQGQVLVAEGSLRAHTGRSGIYDVQVTADDVLVAEFRGRARTIPHRLQERSAQICTAPRGVEAGPGPEVDVVVGSARDDAGARR
ncbi:PaaI family thioesterase [Arthrobacter sp. RIT-PI-e]|uniref:PaaI family thioesterase n=1 Tax=Arthrobacter sp. RIT-PI-e TaxID=1681197 RepID=UPI0009E442F8|nr:hotdog fold thioesterase [Arthrobacter sp. RIT-PI-e]